MIKNTHYTLRKFTNDDTIGLFKALSDKRVVKHMASTGITFADCHEIISGAIEHWKKHNIGSYAVIAQKNDTIVGWAGFKFWNEDEFEIVIVLSPKYWGLGSMICDELLSLAKDKFSLNKVFILLPETRKSFRWIQRKGFTYCFNEIFNDESFRKFVKVL